MYVSPRTPLLLPLLSLSVESNHFCLLSILCPSKSLVVDQMGHTLCLGLLLDFWLELADLNGAELGEEGAVDGHCDVEAKGDTEGLEDHLSHTELLGHQAGLS